MLTFCVIVYENIEVKLGCVEADGMWSYLMIGVPMKVIYRQKLWSWKEQHTEN